MVCRRCSRHPDVHYHWVVSHKPDWQGGFAQVQSGTAKKSYSIGKALMAVDFSQSVATLQQTFASVESFQGYDGITYTTLLCPIVFC